MVIHLAKFSRICNDVKFRLLMNSHGALYKALGELYVRQGSFAEARAIFRTGIDASPSFAELYHAYALFEAKLGNLEVILPQQWQGFDLCNNNQSSNLGSSRIAWKGKAQIPG